MAKEEYVSGKMVAVTFALLFLALWYMATKNSGGSSEPTPIKNAEVTVKEVPKIIGIKKDSLICFGREEWESMKSNIADNNLQGMRLLFDAAKCQKTIEVLRVTYLEEVAGNTAMVQMPSGRVAFVFNQDISK